jgi:hypothetical protein
MYPRYAVSPTGYRHRIQIGIRSQGTRLVSQITNSDKQKRIVCPLLAFIHSEFHVTRSNAQAQSANQLAAQQSFLTNLSQPQAVIDSSSDAVRDQLSKAQIAYKAATTRQSQLAFATWKDIGTESLKLLRPAIFGAGTTRQNAQLLAPVCLTFTTADSLRSAL